MTDRPALVVDGLEFRYGPLQALAGVSFEVAPGEIFGLLGPNGGGKTTLFRILSTLMRPQMGRVELFGHDVATEPERVRECIGVVFQHPSVDLKLTVDENLRHHGMLHGLRGGPLGAAIDAALGRLGIRDRAGEIVETLSGGLRRRVELAKGLVTRPRLLILDEPSNGLDPGARRDLGQYLRSLREDDNATILLTTHLMEEAEHCDRLAILDRGRIVTIGTPDGLRRKIGGEIITIRSPDPEGLSALIMEQFGASPSRLGDVLRIERPQGHVFVRQLVESFSDRITAISLGKPTLEDVFVRETGHRFWGDA
jgi:ABC-2 type transport system ATP-binding protein